MSTKDTKPNAPGRKRKDHYNEKLKIKGSLFDVLKVAVTPKPEEGNKKEE